MTMRKMTIFIVLLALLGGAGAILLAALGWEDAYDPGVTALTDGTAPADAEGAPEAGSIPAFTLADGASLYMVTDGSEPGDELLETVQTMDAMFAAAEMPSKTPMPIRSGKRAWATAGDIVLQIDVAYGSGSAVDAAPANGADLSIASDQGYTIAPAADGCLQVTAGTADGIWYGLTDLLQRCMAGEEAIEAAITDAPDSAERTLLLDCGRKYYSRTWIENLIRRISWQRYTSLHLHFSDTEGFGLESKKYPWLNEGDYLTFEDLDAICETARKHHIEIIPELDSPGHLHYVVDHYAAHAAADPGFTFDYGGKTYAAADEGGSSISNYYVYGGARSAYSGVGIDLSNQTATAFLGSLIDEYADYFAEQGSTKFCIGGDELFGWNGASVGGRTFTPYELWSAMEHWATYAQEALGIEGGSASDTFVSYLNDLTSHLGEKGLACRVWNDQLLRTDDQHVTLDRAIDIIYWSNDYTPMTRLADAGNQIHSSNTDWCYYVIRQDKRGGDIMDRTRKYCASRYIYERWDPRNCAGPKQEETLIPEASFAGGYFCIWADSPNYKTAQTVWADTQYRTWANATKLWNHDAERSVSYDDFRARLDQMGDFPGFSGDCETDSSLPEASSLEQVNPGARDRLMRGLQGLFGR